MAHTHKQTEIYHTANGSTTSFSYPFEYYQKSDVHVTVNGTAKTQGTHYDVTGTNVVFKTSPTDYTPANTEVVRVYRDTDVNTSKATFAPGSSIRATDLNSNETQLLFSVQEAVEQEIVTADIRDGQITTAKIKDGAVTLAKMAGLARRKLIYGDTSGDPAALAVGTANYVLTSDGTDIAWAAEGSIGLHSIFIPAAAMRPTKSNGCGSIADTETTSGRPDLTGLPFDDGSDEHAQFQVALPKQWNLGTVTYQVFWASTATDTDGVSWALQGCSVPDNSTIDLAYGTAIVVDDANQGAAEELCVSAVSSAVTIAGTPADDDMCFFRVFRDVSDGNDTAAEEAILIGIKLFITTDVGNDA